MWEKEANCRDTDDVGPHEDMTFFFSFLRILSLIDSFTTHTNEIARKGQRKDHEAVGKLTWARGSREAVCGNVKSVGLQKAFSKICLRVLE